MIKWKKITSNYNIQHLDHNDECYFLMDYAVGQGYQYSDSNNRILNLKYSKAQKPQSVKYIDQSINQFFQDLIFIINWILEGSENVSLTFIPRARKINDNLEQVANKIKDHFTHQVILELPIENQQPRQQSSQITTPRNQQYVKDLKSNFRWLGFDNKPEVLVIFDDVITTGAQFKAYKTFIQENLASLPPKRIIGLFWARAIAIDDSSSTVS